jgi:hypothetical protein
MKTRLMALGLGGLLLPDSGMGLLEEALVTEMVGAAAGPGPVIGQMLAEQADAAALAARLQLVSSKGQQQGSKESFHAVCASVNAPGFSRGSPVRDRSEDF